MKKIIVVKFNTNNIDLMSAQNFISEIRNQLNEYAIIGTFEEFADIKCINDENAIIYIDGTHFHYTIDELRTIIQEHENKKLLFEVKTDE